MFRNQKVCWAVLLAILPVLAASNRVCGGSCGLIEDDCCKFAGCTGDKCGFKILPIGGWLKHCKECDGGEYRDGEVCKCCYWPDCGSGKRRSGTECSGKGTSDSQKDKCADCVWPNCGSGKKRTGNTCTGTHTLDWQQGCGSCSWPNCESGKRRTGTQCTGTTKADTQKGCGSCSWPNCGSGKRRTGTECTGTTQADTQQGCSSCSWPNCGSGKRRTGLQCTGTTHVDTQQGCGFCYWPNCGSGKRRTGTECTGTATVDTQQGCTACSWPDCGKGRYRSGTECTGTHKGDNQDKCSSCEWPDCGKGFYRSGMECIGTSFADTQKDQCTACKTSCPKGYRLEGSCTGLDQSDTTSCVLIPITGAPTGSPTPLETATANSYMIEMIAGGTGGLIAVAFLLIVWRRRNKKIAYEAKQKRANMHHEIGSIDMKIDYRNSSPFAGTKKYVVVHSFQAEKSDELSAEKGEILNEVMPLPGSKEWLLCFSSATGKKGLIPVGFLSEYKGGLVHDSFVGSHHGSVQF